MLKDFTSIVDQVKRLNTPTQVLGAVVLFFVLTYLANVLAGWRYPFANWDLWEPTYVRQLQFLIGARKILDKGVAKFGGPFWVISDFGPKIILDTSYIEHINREPGLSFYEGNKKDMMAELPGFEVFASGPEHMLVDLVRQKLTKQLPHLVEPISKETAMSLNETWGQSTEWKELMPQKDLGDMISQLSASVFVGPQLAHNARWRRISVDFTIDLFTCNQLVRIFPKSIRPWINAVLPPCRRLRAEIAEAKSILMPIIEARKKEQVEARAAGTPIPDYDDTLTWSEEVAKGRDYDPTLVQLGLTMAAIHTTTDVLTETLFHLSQEPEIIDNLRSEITQTITQLGWTRETLDAMPLLDSVLKESQRIKPIGLAFMNRLALKDVELPGGVKIRKGETLMVSSHRMWDEQVWPEVARFNPYRYMTAEQINPGQRFVSTSKDFTAFGHGRTACPGRFFAAFELKIALIHIVLKYDLKLKPGSSTKPFDVGAGCVSNRDARLLVRRRTPEVDI